MTALYCIIRTVILSVAVVCMSIWNTTHACSVSWTRFSLELPGDRLHAQFFYFWNYNTENVNLSETVAMRKWIIILLITILTLVVIQGSITHSSQMASTKTTHIFPNRTSPHPTKRPGSQPATFRRHLGKSIARFRVRNGVQNNEKPQSYSFGI